MYSLPPVRHSLRAGKSIAEGTGVGSPTKSKAVRLVSRTHCNISSSAMATDHEGVFSPSQEVDASLTAEVIALLTFSGTILEDWGPI